MEFDVNEGFLVQFLKKKKMGLTISCQFEQRSDIIPFNFAQFFFYELMFY